MEIPGGKTAKEEDTKRYLPLLAPRRGFEPCVIALESIVITALFLFRL